MWVKTNLKLGNSDIYGDIYGSSTFLVLIDMFSLGYPSAIKGPGKFVNKHELIINY